MQLRKPKTICFKTIDVYVRVLTVVFINLFNEYDIQLGFFFYV